MRYVRFGARADRNRRALPSPVRRLVTDLVIRLASEPAPRQAADLPSIAQAGPEAGLSFSVVVHGAYFVVIGFRFVVSSDELWIELLERAYVDEPGLISFDDPRGGSTGFGRN